MRAAGRHGKALLVFLGAVAVLLVAGAILWGASRLDERERPTEVADDGSGRPKDLFVVEVKEERRPTIVVECDEGVLADANARFRDFLGVKDPPISIPGGPMLFARLPEEWSEEHGPLARSAIEVLKRYSPEKVVLIGHSECLLYDVAGAYAGQEDFVPVAQAADLAKAAKHVRAWLPRARVEAYYGRKDGPRIRYNAVPLPEKEEVR
jgi:hypothetical protein